MRYYKSDILILGSGIAGLSAAYHLKLENYYSIILEKDSVGGGLCGTFELDGFKFDNFVHLSFSENEYVKSLFHDSTEIIKHNPESLNYYNKKWLRHPVQNNLYFLNTDEKIKVIRSFIERDEKIKVNNYEDWLKKQYGTYFSEKFPMAYTRKYWTIDAKYLETEWVGKRMYIPNIEEILYGAFENNSQNVYYAKEMRYPIYGGYQSFLSKMINDVDCCFNKHVIKIDLNKKHVLTQDGSIYQYKYLISTIPITELCNIILGVPKDVLAASKRLKYTSGILVSVGLSKPSLLKTIWIYIYDEDILPSRIYAPSLKSIYNVPEGCGSLQAEIYFSNQKPIKDNMDEIKKRTIEKMIEMGLFEKEDIIVSDIRRKKYANVMFTNNIYQDRKIVHNYLDNKEIFYAGRFGEWDYLWSDQSLISGKKAAEKLITNL